MAINLYRGFTNQITGESFRCLSYEKDAFIFEWLVEPEGYIPFEHIHLHQDEIFHIRKGEIRIIIDGVEFIAGEGESITVPKGKRHVAYNNQPSLLECVVEYRPGLDNYTFFQCFGGLTSDGAISSDGTVNIPRMLYFTRKMNAKCLTRPTQIPAPLFQLAIHFFYLIGILLGWKKLYDKYTDAGRESVAKEKLSMPRK